MPRSRRHHYLPVFLLSNFGVRGTGRRLQVRGLRNGQVFQSNARNVGVETDFHSASTFFPDPERLLSDWEGKFAGEMKRWSGGLLDEQGTATADRFVVHVRMRSKTLRATGGHLAKLAWRSMQRGIDEVEAAACPHAALRSDVASLLDAAAQHGRDGTWNENVRADVLDRVAHERMSCHVSQWLVGQAARAAREMLTEDTAQEILTGVHTTLLLTMLLNHRRNSGFGPRVWRVVKIENESLLLGDIGPLCRYHGTIGFQPFYLTNRPLADVCLPIAPDRLLLGRVDDSLPVPSTSELNDATLALSHEFVVGTWAEDQFKGASDRFGVRSKDDTPEAVFGINVPEESQPVHEIAKALSMFVSDRFGAYWTLDKHAARLPATVNTDIVQATPQPKP